MPTSRMRLASMAWRMPPKPAMNSRPTPIIETRLDQNIDDWLACISSASMIGKPVSPILVCGCLTWIWAISSRSAAVASSPAVKLLSLLSASRNSTKPSCPSLANRYSLFSSLSTANDCGMSAKGRLVTARAG